MQVYFQNLNYSMANEDTTLEYELGRSLNAKNILTVGGSGSRSLPFLALSIEKLTIVDISPDQILFIQFKLETIKQLIHADAVSFWTDENKEVRDAIFRKMTLDSKFQDFYKFHSEANPKLAPLYWGNWEKAFRTFSKLTKLLFKKEIREGLFKVDNPYEYFEKHIKGRKWNTLIKIVGNKAMFNSFLYKGSFIKKNSKLSYFDYYYQAYERLLQLDVKRSHFLQLCFCGKVFLPEGLPIEFEPGIFQKIKESKVTPNYQQGSIFERSEDTKYDLVSLSDVPSYLSGEMEVNYLQMLKKNVSESGVVVNRFYLRTTEKTNEQGYLDVTHEHRGLVNQELVQMYEVQLLKRTEKLS